MSDTLGQSLLESVRPCGAGVHAGRCVDNVSEGSEGIFEGGGLQAESGVRAPMKAQDPRRPTQEEVDAHNMTHLPYRSWCTHCVRGRGESHPHRRTSDDDRELPELHMDYCFMGKVDERTQPILVLRERSTRMTCSFLTKEKGTADEYVARRVLAFIKELGHESSRLIIKSDQESSVRAVADAVARARGDVPTLLEHSPVRASGSNGVVERGIKEIEGQVRAMKSALDEPAGCDVRSTSNVLPWMVEYAAVLLNRYMVGHDGKTAHERSRGKASRMLGFEFGEQVHFRRVPVHGRLGKLDSLWQTGIYLGFRTQSAEYMIANSEGAFKTRTVKRVPEESRWNATEIENLRWTPWKFKETHGSSKPAEADEVDHNPFLEVEVDKSIDLPAPAKIEEEAMPRRVYITRATLNRYGMTEGCLGCTTSSIGGTGVPHSEECRRRIEREMKHDPIQRHRIKEAQSRRKEFIDRHAKRLRTSGDKESINEEVGDAIATDSNEEASKKRKAIEDPDGDNMESMHCMCEISGEENGLDGHTGFGLTVDNIDDDIGEHCATSQNNTQNFTHDVMDAAGTPAMSRTVYDDITQRPLKYERVLEARMDEIRALQDMGVWEVVPLSQCISKTGKRRIRGRWVDVNKGDDQNENYRSRYVAMEIKHQHGASTREGLFAAMPPLESMRILLSHVASHRDASTGYKLMFVDISKAYLHAHVLSENIYVALPEEMNMPDMCGRLIMALYGTRQAARAWEEEYAQTLVNAGFRRGLANPCMFWHVERDIKI